MLVHLPLHKTLHLGGTLGRKVPQEHQGLQVLLDRLDLMVTLVVLGLSELQVFLGIEEILEVQVRLDFQVFQEILDPRVSKELQGNKEILDREVTLAHKDLKVSLRSLAVMCKGLFLTDPFITTTVLFHYNLLLRNDAIKGAIQMHALFNIVQLVAQFLIG